MQIGSCKICLKSFRVLKIKPKPLWMAPHDFFSTSTSRSSIPALPLFTLWCRHARRLARQTQSALPIALLCFEGPSLTSYAPELLLLQPASSWVCLTPTHLSEMDLDLNSPETLTRIPKRCLVPLCALISLSAYFCDDPPVQCLAHSNVSKYFWGILMPLASQLCDPALKIHFLQVIK